MKNRFETLRAREVPEALDRRIMAAAAQRAGAIRFRRTLVRCFLSTGAAAAALMNKAALPYDSPIWPGCSSLRPVCRRSFAIFETCFCHSKNRFLFSLRGPYAAKEHFVTTV